MLVAVRSEKRFVSMGQWNLCDVLVDAHTFDGDCFVANASGFTTDAFVLLQEQDRFLRSIDRSIMIAATVSCMIKTMLRVVKPSIRHGVRILWSGNKFRLFVL